MKSEGGMKIRPVDTIQPVVKKPTWVRVRPRVFGSSLRKKPWKQFFQGVLVGILVVLLCGSVFVWQGLGGEKGDLIRLLLASNGHYLILFQNNTELRPTGGFIGSFAEVELRHGLLKDYQFETNIYKRDKKLTAQKCLPLPSPMKEIWPNGCGTMRDSNWAVDFSQAAAEIEGYYLQEGGGEVDGVIAIDASFFVDLLRIIGPIELPQYQMTLNPENFLKETQYYVEKEYFEDPQGALINEPKTILKDMFPIVLQRIKNPKVWSLVIKTTLKNLREKHILLNFKEPWLSQIVEKYDWGGRVKTTDGDYLYLNNANLGGQKSSLNVKQKVSFTVRLGSNGTLLHTLSLRRTHQGNGLWPDGINQNYTRILVPKGSLLVSTQGIERVDLSEESGKTVFGFWSTVAPKETKTFTIVYQTPPLPLYHLLVQKQPGAEPNQFLFYLQTDTRQWRWEGLIDEDRLISVDLTSS